MRRAASHRSNDEDAGRIHRYVSREIISRCAELPGPLLVAGGVVPADEDVIRSRLCIGPGGLCCTDPKTLTPVESAATLTVASPADVLNLRAHPRCHCCPAFLRRLHRSQ